MDESVVTVLCSGVALGVYVPAVLVAERLRACEVEAELAVYESLYPQETQEELLELRRAYHQSFKLALLGHRLTNSKSGRLDAQKVERLLDRWESEGRRRFVVWSGLWMPVLARYRAMRPSWDFEVDVCRIDAVESASFKGHEVDVSSEREVWLWNSSTEQLEHRLLSTDDAPISSRERERRYVLHGGGWGIGTYRDSLAPLQNLACSLDLVCYEEDEIGIATDRLRFLRVDPDWLPWRLKSEETGYPRIQLVRRNEDGTIDVCESSDGRTHEFGNYVKAARSIVSKPGGGTLIDSLSSATPVVFLEPYGFAEEKNAAFWISRGYGTTFEAWRESNYSEKVIERLCQNLLSEENWEVPRYPDCYYGAEFRTVR